VAYRIRTLSPAEAPAFGSMTFPAFRGLLGSLLTKDALAVGAYSGDEPAGLALISPSQDRAEAELLSLFVSLPHRNCGLGTKLLAQAENMLKQAEVSRLHTSWSETVSGAAPFSAVLAARDWSEPCKRMFLLRGDMDGDFGKELQEKYPKYKSPSCLPGAYSLTFWRDMTGADREFIRSKQGLPNWYEPRANPFREESALESGNSLLLRKGGEIVGWLTVHRIGPRMEGDTLRYTDVFIREDLKRAGAAVIAMVVHAFWLQLGLGVAKLTMAVDKANEPLVRMFVHRMSCARLSWTWGAEKILGK
jgi:GNAT superfamily N-acetyltransferase